MSSTAGSERRFGAAFLWIAGICGKETPLASWWPEREAFGIDQTKNEKDSIETTLDRVKAKLGLS